jgi:hypothetical protein
MLFVPYFPPFSNGFGYFADVMASASSGFFNANDVDKTLFLHVKTS